MITARKSRTSLTLLLLVVTGVTGCSLDEARRKAEEMGRELVETTRRALPDGQAELEKLTEATKTLNKEVVASLLESVKPKTAETNLDTYSRETDWTMKGALGTTTALLAANCKLNRNKNSSCLKNAKYIAPAGLILGGVGGWILANKQKSFANEKQQLTSELNAAQQELAEAKSARISAQRLIKFRAEEILLLKAEAKKSDAARKKLDKSLAEAKKDESTLRKAIDRLRQGNKILKEESEARTASSPEAAELNKVYKGLVSERSLMDEQLSLLLSAVDSKA